MIKWGFEDGLCFKLDKVFFGLDHDMFLIFVYMRSTSSTRNNLVIDNHCYEILQEKIADLREKGQIIVSGDFNARTSTKDECVIETIEERLSRVDDEERLFVPNAPYDYVITCDDLINNGMSLTRANSDSVNTEYGTRLLNLTYACDLIMLNGRHPGDPNGKLTFLNHNGKSLIDYVLCDKMSMYKIEEFRVHDVNVYSDHKIISYSIATKVSSNIVLDETGGGEFVRNANKRDDSDTFQAGRSDMTEGEGGLEREQIYAKWRLDKGGEFIAALESNLSKKNVMI